MVSRPRMKTGGIIQARHGSVRLPGKVLLPLPYGAKTSVLEHIIRRAGKSRRLDAVIVATTTRGEDDGIAALCRKLKVPCFRGDAADVLSRYVRAAGEHGIDVIVRLTGDNPCLDAGVIDAAVDRHREMKNDYTRTVRYPTGLNVEVVSFEALRASARHAVTAFEKEHVTLHLAKNPEKFKNHLMTANASIRDSNLRITLDTKEDYALLCSVFDQLHAKIPFFGAREILELFKRKPWLRLINARVAQKRVFDTLEEELAEAARLCGAQDLKKARAYLEKRLCGIGRSSPSLHTRRRKA